MDSEDEGKTIEQQIQDHARNGVSDADLCELYDLQQEDLQTRFAKILTKARAERRANLHDLQTQAAKKLSATLLTHLGRHELGQNTKAAVAGTADQDGPEPQLD